MQKDEVRDMAKKDYAETIVFKEDFIEKEQISPMIIRPKSILIVILLCILFIVSSYI